MKSIKEILLEDILVDDLCKYCDNYIIDTSYPAQCYVECCWGISYSGFIPTDEAERMINYGR